jgi:hypothetical protein
MGLLMEDKRLVQQGFNNVEIEKERLLSVIRENKKKHISEYEASVKSYEQAKLAYAQEFWAQLSENIGLVKTSLNEKLETVSEAVLNARAEHEKDGGKIDLKDVNAYISLSLQPRVQLAVKEPVSHEKEYNIAIRSLELTTAEFIYLDQSNFSKYVLDEWDWKQEFSYNNSILYSGASMVGNSYFYNGPSVISTGSNFVTKFGDTMTGNLIIASGLGILPSASGISTLGKTTQLFNTIVNGSTLTSNTLGGK